MGKIIKKNMSSIILAAVVIAFTVTSIVVGLASTRKSDNSVKLLAAPRISSSVDNGGKTIVNLYKTKAIEVNVTATHEEQDDSRFELKYIWTINGRADINMTPELQADPTHFVWGLDEFYDAVVKNHNKIDENVKDEDGNIIQLKDVEIKLVVVGYINGYIATEEGIWSHKIDFVFEYNTDAPSIDVEIDELPRDETIKPEQV